MRNQRMVTKLGTSTARMTVNMRRVKPGGPVDVWEEVDAIVGGAIPLGLLVAQVPGSIEWQVWHERTGLRILPFDLPVFKKGEAKLIAAALNDIADWCGPETDFQGARGYDVKEEVRDVVERFRTPGGRAVRA